MTNTAGRRRVSAISLALLAASGGNHRAEGAAGWRWPPQEWVAFGPVIPDPKPGSRGLPDPNALLPEETLRSIPDAMTIAGTTFKGSEVSFVNQRLDLAARFGGVERGKLVCLMAPLELDRNLTVRMGASADWYMQWWLDGRPIYSTLKTGNLKSDFKITDHVFDVHLTAGEHVLSVAVISGSSSFLLVVGDPGDMDLGMTCEQQGQHESAVEAFARVVEMPQVSVEIASEARLHIGHNLKALGRYQEAVRQYRLVLAMTGNPRFHRSRALLEMADSHYQSHDLPAALKAYGQVTQLSGRGIPLRHRSLARHEIRRIRQEVAK